MPTFKSLDDSLSGLYELNAIVKEAMRSRDDADNRREELRAHPERAAFVEFGYVRFDQSLGRVPQVIIAFRVRDPDSPEGWDVAIHRMDVDELALRSGFRRETMDADLGVFNTLILDTLITAGHYVPVVGCLLRGLVIPAEAFASMPDVPDEMRVDFLPAAPRAA